MFHKNQPKVKLQKSTFDWGLEFLVYLFVALGWIFLILYYSELPDKVATHFGFSGKPDGYGSKATMVMLPVISTLLSIGTLLLCKIPHQFNYLITITEDNAKVQYTIANRMMRLNSFVMSSGFFLLLAHSVYISLGGDGLGPFAGLYLLLGIFAVMPWYFIASSRADSKA